MRGRFLGPRNASSSYQVAKLAKVFQGLDNRQKLGLLGIVGGLHTTVVGGSHVHIGHIVQLLGKMLHEAIIERANVAKPCNM